MTKDKSLLKILSGYIRKNPEKGEKEGEKEM
jgi:hypothetical protein